MFTAPTTPAPTLRTAAFVLAAALPLQALAQGQAGAPARGPAAPAAPASAASGPAPTILVAPRLLPDQEVVTPDGRRVVLKSDFTWAYVEDDAPVPAPPVQAELSLLSSTPRGPGCQFALALANRLPYPVRALVPLFTAQRADGIGVETVSAAFQNLRPGDTQQRNIVFAGIGCADIDRVVISGGDRCEMGELTRFVEGKGLCLARVKLLPSTVAKFEK